MAYEIVVKKRFSNDLIEVLNYLETEWSEKVASEFLGKAQQKIESLIDHPFSGELSPKVLDVRALVITRHNKLYYRVKGSKIFILKMFDTRMNPKKNRY